MPEPRRAIIARDPSGQTVVIGPVGSRAAIDGLRATLARHGWAPGADAVYKSRAEFVREQVAPAYADAVRHRIEAHGGAGCNCPADWTSPDVPVPVEMPVADFTHTVGGFFGEQLTIVAYAPVDAEDGGAVEFVIMAGHGRTAGAHISSPAEREALMRALMEAYRVADGEKPATETRTEDDDLPCTECGQARSMHEDAFGRTLNPHECTGYVAPEPDPNCVRCGWVKSMHAGLVPCSFEAAAEQAAVEARNDQ